MTTKTIKLLVLIALLVHGIGHFQGVIASLGVKFNDKSNYISWLLKGQGQNVNKILCLGLYLGAAILGILAALSFKGILLPVSCWETLSLITAIVSTSGLILFPNALAMFFNKIGAIVVNLAIYYSILFNGNWPSVIFED